MTLDEEIAGEKESKRGSAKRSHLRGLRFRAAVSGVIARDLSEKIEKAIIQHCESFTKGNGHCDLCRFDQDWEVKICKDSG